MISRLGNKFVKNELKHSPFKITTSGKNKARAENLVAIFEIYGPKNGGGGGGVTKRFLMVTVENYEIRSSKP